MTRYLQITTDKMYFQFFNVNKQMGLKGHSHLATIECTFKTPYGRNMVGFPVFQVTISELHRLVLNATKKPFKDCTNEQLVDCLFETVKRHNWHSPWEYPDVIFELAKIKVRIRGVIDDIGHSDSWATYEIGE